MFVSRGRYNDLKAAHKREVEILVSWVEQLQTQIGAMGHSPREQGEQGEQKISADPQMSLYISAEEEDLIDAHAQELIDDEQFQQGMAALGRTTATIG
jgi:hypothetical protein